MRVDTGRLRVVASETVASPEPRRDQRPEARPRAKPDRRQDVAEVGSDGADEYDSPGPYIKAQRRRRGMSLEQLAAATKIPRAQLELLEADRYEELPGMVFAKGFLRCCARALELDHDTVLGLLYERERAQLRRRRREAAVAADEPKPGASRGRPRARPRKPEGVVDEVRSWVRGRVQGRVQGWIADAVQRLPSARILMWIVVALFVALVVFIAFTLASGQAQTMTIRS